MTASFRKTPDSVRPAVSGRVFPSLLFLLVLSACAVDRGLELPDMPDWEARRAFLADVSEWEFRGRIGVRTTEDGFNGNLRWWQNDEVFLASVSGPFGAGTVRIQGHGGEVSITDQDGEVTEMQDAETVLRRRYGWTIPVTSLRYWALGIPDPSRPAVTGVRDDGLLNRLEQGSWDVTIDEYREDGGQLMPRRMTATHLDTRVRIVIDNWTFY